MRRRLLFFLTSTLCVACRSHTPSAPDAARSSAERIVYPAAPTNDASDDYFGTRVADPYRPLEDPDAPATRAWVEAENRLTRAWIDAVPERAEIEARLKELWDYERVGVPSLEGGKTVFARNAGLENQPTWFVADSPDAPPRIALDANALSKDGTISVEATRTSPDGKLLAYATSEAGSDWEVVRVRELATGKELDDRVEWVKFSTIAWSADAQGFYYSTFPMHDTSGNVKLEKHELRYHRLGTPQSADALVYARPDEPEWGFTAQVTHDGEVLVITVTKGTDPRTQLFMRDLRKADAKVVELVTGFDAEYEALEKHGSKLYVRTDLGAPTKRVIAIDLGHPDRLRWRDVVPANPKRTLESALVLRGVLVCAWLEDAHSVVTVHDVEKNATTELDLGGIGSVNSLSGTAAGHEAFFSFSSFAAPARVLRLDAATKTLSTWRAPKTRFDPADFVTELQFATSRDGTRVPLFVTRRKDVVPSAETPCLLYGYGGFDVPIKPEFSPAVLAWMDRGALYASAVLRGGGEYGRDWHAAGTKERKQNVFDDFIACAEHLIAKGWTSSKRLAIHGRSNGGLLVGACLTQRPELFGAALPGVGVLDMLRYDQFTIGWAWESDYGSARKERAAFEYLAKYSPLHNVRPGTCYPPTLVTTADHDDRVVPAHSYKFTAALQAAQACANPVLVRIDVRAGHGAGKPTSMRIAEIVDEWAFLWRALGMSRVR